MIDQRKAVLFKDILNTFCSTKAFARREKLEKNFGHRAELLDSAYGELSALNILTVSKNGAVSLSKAMRDKINYAKRDRIDRRLLIDNIIDGLYTI